MQLRLYYVTRILTLMHQGILICLLVFNYYLDVLNCYHNLSIMLRFIDYVQGSTLVRISYRQQAMNQ